MNEPKLRFPEFTGAWEQRKLGDIAPITMGQSPNGNTYSDTPSDYILVQGNADLQNGWVTPRMWTTQVTKKADAGDLIMSVRAPAGAMGKTAYDAVIGRGVAAIKGNEFIYQLLVKMDSDGYWKPLACGSTFESLNSNNIKNANVLIPNTDEQTKIGTCFANLDNLIQSAEKELEGYRELKQCMLQKMFPKKGEKVPEIRFPEFTGDWEQRKLGDTIPVVTDYVAAGSFADIAANVNYKSEPDYAQLVRTVDLKHNFENNDSIYVDKKAFDYLYRVNLDEESIVLPNIGANIGEVYYIEPSALPYERNVLGPNAIYLKPCKNTKFIYSLFQTVDFQKKLMISIASSGQPKFNKTELKEITITLPNNDEQKKIGEYFSNLDNLITLQQKEIDGYKELKKGLLQQMFC